MKLTQVQYYTDEVRYFLVDQQGNSTRIICTNIDTLRSIWETADKESLNFSFNDGVLRYPCTVIKTTLSSQALRGFDILVPETRNNLWSLLNILSKTNAKVEVCPGLLVPVTAMRFSLTTPSIVIGGYLGNDYHTRTIWSYDPEQASDFVTIHLTEQDMQELLEYGISILESESTNDPDFPYCIKLKLSRFPIVPYTESIFALLALCADDMCANIIDSDVAQSALDGLNCAYKLLREANGVNTNVKSKFMPKDTDKIYAKNVKIVRYFNKPSVYTFNKTVFDPSSDYFLRKLLDPTVDPEDIIRRLIFNDRNPLFVDAFMLGFNLIYAHGIPVPEHEYRLYTRQLREQIFASSLKWFSTKIQILDLDATSFASSFNLNAGTIELQYLMHRIGGPIHD